MADATNLRANKATIIVLGLSCTWYEVHRSRHHNARHRIFCCWLGSCCAARSSSRFYSNERPHDMYDGYLVV